jgi:hypothetical protein
MANDELQSMDDLLSEWVDSGGEFKRAEPKQEPAPKETPPVGEPQPKAEPAPGEETSSQAARQQAKRVGDAVQSVIDRAALPAGRAHDAIAAAPTPGGIGVLVIALLFFVWAIVPFNGHTRLEWLWLTITGRSRLQGRRILREHVDITQGGWSGGGDQGGGGGGGGDSGFNGMDPTSDDAFLYNEVGEDATLIYADDESYTPELV